MAIQGLRDADDFVIGGARAQRPENWREGSLLLFPNGQAPLTGLSSRMRSESTDDPKFHHFEKVMDDQRLQLSVDAGTGTGLTVVAGGFSLKDGHILYIEHTREIVRVNGDPASDTALVVVRSEGVVAATDVLIASQNPFMTVIGTAHEEGSAKPTGIAYDPTEQFNFTQIFRNNLEMTETARRTRLRTGEQVKEAKREAFQYHTIEIERASFFGDRAETTKNSRPLRYTEGFTQWMVRRASTRIATVASGNLHMGLLEDYMMQIFEYGSSEKMAFLGNRAALALQQAVRKADNISYTLVQGQKEFGMNVSRLISPFGELVLKTHPLFTRMKSEATPGYYGVETWIAVMDMEKTRYRYLTGRDTAFDGDQEAPGDDQMVAGYLTECGFEWQFPETHFLIKQAYAGIAEP